MFKKNIFGMITFIVGVMLAFSLVGCGDSGSGDPSGPGGGSITGQATIGFDNDQNSNGLPNGGDTLKCVLTGTNVLTPAIFWQWSNTTTGPWTDIYQANGQTYYIYGDVDASNSIPVIGKYIRCRVVDSRSINTPNHPDMKTGTLYSGFVGPVSM